jgi:TolB-like protein/AraC-like DNA-binding protein
MDRVFLDRLQGLVEANLSDERFGVEEVARELGMSRASIHRKLKQLTGKSLGQTIREIRLERAMELLRQNAGTASEIAYRTGFGSPAYFNHCFHNHFGYPPGDVRKHAAQEQQSHAPAEAPTDRQPGYRQRYFLPAVLLPVVLLTLGYALYATLIRPPESGKTKGAEPVRSIAVLPFINDSPDPDNQQLCNGIVEAISDKLQSISALQVKSRISSARYRNQDRDAVQIGRELGAAWLLEGSVRKAGDQMRIAVQLTDVRTGDLLWSEIYESRYTEAIFDFQTEVAEKVAASIWLETAPLEWKSRKKDRDAFIRSYDQSDQGWEEIHDYQTSGDIAYLRNAEIIFSRLIEQDPESHQGYIGMSFIHGHRKNWVEYLQACEKAIELTPSWDAGYGMRGTYYRKTCQPDKALADYYKVIRNNPTNPYAFMNLSRVYFLWKMDIRAGAHYAEYPLKHAVDPLLYVNFGEIWSSIGELPRAKEYFKMALDTRVGCQAIHEYAFTLYANGLFDECTALLDSICLAMPCPAMCHLERFQNAFYSRDWDLATAEYGLWAADSASFAAEVRNQADAAYACILHHRGRHDEAAEITAQLIAIHKNGVGGDEGNPLFQLARLHAMAGNKNTAIQYLRDYEKLTRAFSHYEFIKIDPLLDNIRNEPEFQRIVQRADAERAALVAQIRKLEEEGVLERSHASVMSRRVRFRLNDRM